MATDLSLPLREQIVSYLATDANLTALVPASRIYGEQPPAMPDWPFIRYGLPIATPYEATCWDGSTHRVTIHAFAEGPGMDNAALIAAQVVKTMADFTPDGFSLSENEWTGTNIVRDGDEADKYHAIIEFTITAIA